MGAKPEPDQASGKQDYADHHSLTVVGTAMLVQSSVRPKGAEKEHQ